MGMSPRKCAILLLAFFCPPLALVIARDALDSYFWLNLVLWLLGALPGILHAYWVLLYVMDSEREGLEPLTRPFAGDGFV